MKSLTEIRSVKKTQEEKYIHQTGITGIDVGPKIVGGETTEEVAIRFYVAKKKKNVPAKEKIPETLEGVKTDVIERTFVLHQRKVPLADLVLQADTGTYDPLVGGISIGPCRVIGGFVFTGTLGAIVRDNVSGQRMLLSNWHVMAVNPSFSIGDTMAQPSRVDTGSCPSDVVGELHRESLDGGSPASPGVDGAIARVTARSTDCSIVDIGDVAGTAAATVGMAVRKRGRTTGLTHGTVDSIDLTVNVDYEGVGTVTLFRQIGIEVDSAQSAQFGNSGDSGSVVVDDARKIVGLYFAGTADGSFGVANPIQAVLDALDITICTGKLLEKKDIKEFFEKRKDIKEFKESFKEFKESFKEFKEKDFKEKDFKELFEGPGFPFTGRAAAVGLQDRRCIDFRIFPVGPGPNPLIIGSTSFEAFDHTGAPNPNTQIATLGTHTGLDCGFTLVILLREPCPTVELTLVHFSQPASVAAFNSDGSLAGSDTMSGPQDVPETLSFSGTDITRVVVRAPQDETLLLELCCCDKPSKEKGEKEGYDKPKLEKLEKREGKDKLEKLEKPEIKEKETRKEGPKELKEGPKEFKETKELKEIKEKETRKEGPKELKEGPKEFKEKKELKEIKEKDKEKEKEKELKEKEKDLKEKDLKDKDIKDLKEKDLKDKDKDILEKIRPENPKELVENPEIPGGPLERLERIEAAVAQLTHFIRGDLRPDLSGGALTREPDLDAGAASTSARLRKQAADAKQTKDAKDTEKPREG